MRTEPWTPPPTLSELAASGWPQFIFELVEVFQSDTAERLHQMHRAVEAGDRTAIRRLAHSIRGGALTLGAGRLADLCKELESGPDAAQARLEALSAAIDESFLEARLSIAGYFLTCSLAAAGDPDSRLD
jgi:histidine phosphotransfer protein HptB